MGSIHLGVSDASEKRDSYYFAALLDCSACLQ